MNWRMELSPRVAFPVAGLLLLVLGFLAYRWWSKPESYLDEQVWVKAAHRVLEQPVRDKLKREGRSESEINERIAAMWRSGELKLPPGKPGKDWAAGPGGIRMLPKPEDLMKGTPAEPPEPLKTTSASPR